MSDAKRVSARVWMQRLRADGDITKVRLCTLVVLGTYMDSDGSNAHVREATLAGDVGVTDRAVRDHLAYACDRGYLRRVARGHRLGSGETTASTYEATVPGDDVSTGAWLPVEDGQAESQPDPGRRLSEPQPEAGRSSTGRSGGLNRNGDAPQPEAGRSPYKEDQVLLQEQTNLSPVTSAGRAAPVPTAAANGYDEREGLIEWIKSRHRPGGRQIDNPRAYVRACEANGDYPDLLEAMRADNVQRANQPLQPPPLPDHCGKCGWPEVGDQNPAISNPKFRRVGGLGGPKCPTCHPDRVGEGC